MSDIGEMMTRLGQAAVAAAATLAVIATETKNEALTRAAAAIRARRSEILEANARDMAAAQDASLGGPLLDRLLPAEEIARLQEILDADQRVLGYHKVRARKAGSQRHIDLHLLVDEAMSLRDAHRLAEEVEDRIREEFGQSGVHIVTHVEPATEEELAVDTQDPGIQKGTESTRRHGDTEGSRG